MFRHTGNHWNHRNCKKLYPLIQIVRTHQQNTNLALLQTASKFKKYFQSETKQIKNIITQNIKGKWGKRKDAWAISR
jgi:hypothetical protein